MARGKLKNAALTGWRPKRDGKLLRDWRVQRGLTAAQLAGMLDRGESTVCHWERGTCAPSPAAARMLRQMMERKP